MMAKKPGNNDVQSTAVATWEDPGTDISTEADNSIVNEVLAGFRNLDQIQVASGLPFLGLDKAGDWKYGQDAIEPEPGSFWAMDLSTARWGRIAWVDGKPAGESMVSIAQQRAPITELDAGLPWTDQVSIEMVCVSGSDKGVRVLFKTSSVGGVKAFMTYKDMCKRIIPTDPSKPIAVVQLETSSYVHSKYGKITNPALKIAGWASTGILKQGDSGLTSGETTKPPQGSPAEAAATVAPEQSGRRRRVGA